MPVSFSADVHNSTGKPGFEQVPCFRDDTMLEPSLCRRRLPCWCFKIARLRQVVITRRAPGKFCDLTPKVQRTTGLLKLDRFPVPIESTYDERSWSMNSKMRAWIRLKG